MDFINWFTTFENLIDWLSLEQNKTYRLKQDIKIALDMKKSFGNNKQQVVAYSNPNLCVHGITCRSIERLDMQPAFQEFEERLDCPPLVGGVIWKSTKDFDVKQYDDAPANILWMYVGNNTYCFRFEHTSGNIEVREKSYKGEIIKEFNNSTPLSEVKRFFESL